MDADQRHLFVQTVETLISRETTKDLIPVLLAAGFEEARAEDESFVFGALFEIAGRLMSDAPLLDLVISAAWGGPARPVLPVLGQNSEAGHRHGERYVIDGLVLGTPSDRNVLVPLIGPDSHSRLLRVPAGVLDLEAAGGLDPALTISRIRGEVDIDVDGITFVRSPTGADPKALLRRCIGHQLVGLADRLAAMTQEHVLHREQFGRPIGSLQTVHHRLAETHVKIAAARSTLSTAWKSASPIFSAVAKGQAGHAAQFAAANAQQLCGAMGFTWDFGLHHVVRRCYLLDALLGSHTELDGEIGSDILAMKKVERVDVGF